MLVYFKNRHGQVTEIDVGPQETMREVVKKIEELRVIEKVRINMIKYSCSCDNDLTEMLLDDISGDISINIQNDVDKSTEINSIYHELSNKQIKDSVVKEVKDDFELSRKRLKILETQLTTRISQLEGMMYNTIIKQTEQLSRELDEKNDILCEFMDSNIFKNFANSFLQNDIVSESSGNHQMFQKILMVVFKILHHNILSVIHQYLVKVPLLNLSKGERC